MDQLMTRTPEEGNTMRIRQVVLVAEDLEQTRSQIQAVFGIDESFRDPPDGGLGVVNVVMPVGDTFLEVVSPMRPDATTRRYLDTTGGDGGYMVIIQYSDFDAARERAEQAGARWVWKIDFDDQHQWHIHPKDVGAAIVAIDWSDPPSRWRWAGDDWPDHVRDDVVDLITGIELSARDPQQLAARWHAMVGGELGSTADGMPQLLLGRSVVHFTGWDRAYDRMTGIDVRPHDRVELHRRAEAAGVRVHGDAFDLAGVTFRLVDDEPGGSA